MTSRERLITAIQRKKPDRVPLDYWAVEEFDKKIRDYLMIRTDEELKEKLGYDGFKGLWSFLKGDPYVLKTKKQDTEDIKYDLWGVKRERQHYYAGGSYFEITESPLEKMETVSDIEKYSWPRIEDVEFKSIDTNSSQWKRFKSENVILEMSLMGHFGMAWSMRGFQRFLEDLYLNPDIVEVILYKINEFIQALADKFYRQYPNCVDVIGCGDDYSSQDGLLFSKEIFRKYFKPLMKTCYEKAHAQGCFAYKHNCGSIYHLIPDFIDIGLEILNPIQTSAKNMNPEVLKKEFGKFLCFNGGMDVQTILPKGTVAEVITETKHIIKTLGDGGGLILGPAHNIQVDTPPENIIAMYNTAREYKY
jgi:uroporphyrinogen decarboxylase